MMSDFKGRIADAAAGLVGSPAWIESRAKRFLGANLPLTDAQREEMADRFTRAANRARQPDVCLLRPIFSEPALGDTGRIEQVADFDDSPHWFPEERHPVIVSKENAEKAYQRICSDECGMVVDPESLAKKRKEKAIRRAQSHAICRKLELGGETAYTSGDWTLWTYGVHSGEVEEMPKYRRCAFIPDMAAQLREPFVRELEFYLQNNPWARFWTLTGGKRVMLCEVGRSIKTLTKRIRKLNNQPFMKEAGVRIVFRSTELGTVERKRRRNDSAKGVDLLDEKGQLSGSLERDEKGVLWFHPHAHCLVELEKGRLAPKDWSAFLVRVRAYWKDWMDDSGVIRSAREAVKYVTKPGEIQHLSPSETVALFNQLRRKKLVQPLGSLADAIKAREEAGLTLVRERTPDGVIWVEVENWNLRDKVDKTKVATPDLSKGPDFIGPSKPIMVSDADMVRAAKLRTSADKDDVDACVVVARCTPAASRLGIKEPRVVVMGKRFDLARVQAHPLVERLWLSTADQWSAGKALIRVHTGTPSVPEDAAKPPRYRPPSPEFRAHLARLNAYAAQN